MAEAKKPKTSTTLAFVSPTTGAVIEALPTAEYEGRASFIVANDLETFLASGKLDEVEGLVFVAAGGDVKLLDTLYPHLPNCRWVHSFFAGVDALGPFVRGNLTEGAGESIPLTNGKGAFSDSLAEWCMTAILHFNKQIPRVIANRKAKVWDKFVMDTVAGKTLGVVGFGHIGQTTARMAKRAFGMKVLALRNNPDRTSEDADETLGPDRKAELFERSDFVVCALPGTPNTADFCGKPEFESMKKSAVFISVGRGLAVDEVALAAALQSQSIAGAAVDVFKKEPLPTDSPLWDCENLILTAHNADFTADYFDLGWQVFKENLDRFLAGEKTLATEINKGAGY